MWLRNVSRPGALVLAVGMVAAWLVIPAAPVAGRQGAGRQGTVLLVGTSGTVIPTTDKTKEQAGLGTLRTLIKDETGMDNKILQQKDWRELADKLVKGTVAVGVFQGQEYAWAQEKHASLKPLALAVNVYRYPVAYVVTRKADPVKSFDGLAGQPFALTKAGQGYLRLFVDGQARAGGKTMETYFSKTLTPETAEEALDDVVDGVVKATVVDRVALEAYKRRKIGRFKQLKDVAHSKPLPPLIIAHSSKSLDETTRNRFLRGLLDTGRNEKGKMMLNLFQLTAFESVPADFEKVLASTRKDYPEPVSGKE